MLEDSARDTGCINLPVTLSYELSLNPAEARELYRDQLPGLPAGYATAATAQLWCPVHEQEQLPVFGNSFVCFFKETNYKIFKQFLST